MSTKLCQKQSTKLSQKQKQQSIQYQKEQHNQNPTEVNQPNPELKLDDQDAPLPEEKICLLDNPDVPIQQKKRGRKAKPKEEKLRGRWIKCQNCGCCNYFNGQSDMKTTKEEKRQARKSQNSE